MLTRCRNPNFKHWKHYGGRGITVCARWQGEHGFENFLADMGPRPKGKSIEPIKNDGKHEPSNFRLAPQSEQVKNQRKPPLRPRGPDGRFLSSSAIRLLC